MPRPFQSCEHEEAKHLSSPRAVLWRVTGSSCERGPHWASGCQWQYPMVGVHSHLYSCTHSILPTRLWILQEQRPHPGTKPALLGPSQVPSEPRGRKGRGWLHWGSCCQSSPLPPCPLHPDYPPHSITQVQPLNHNVIILEFLVQGKGK